MELTDEQQKDVEERTKQFLDGYTKLVEETQIDFGQMPQFVPIQQGLFSVMIFNQPQDKRYLPVPSPIQNV